MWHSICDGMRSCCNDGGSCCAGVFPRMPCHPVCHPCGPCNPCGPCSPSPCRPCNPCNPCVPCVPCMPCDGAGARGRCISLVAPGVPTSVSAIVALSLLAANHASGACTCPESGPAGLAPGAAPCPGAASAPACPAMAPGCPPAAPGCPAAGPAVHVPCAPPGFSDESACPADQAQAPAGCLRPTLSEVHVDSDRHVESAMQYFWQCLDRKMSCGTQ